MTEQSAMNERKEIALSLFHEYSNCCTAVLAAYGPDFGLQKNLAIRIASGMPGIGVLGNVCGAVSGAALAIGLKSTRNDHVDDVEVRNKAYVLVQEFVRMFETRHSSVQCAALLGHDISTPQKRKTAGEENAFSKCPSYVASAVEILQELFAEM
jgi:C_GCAxxG_C_C family probable redox protein